MSYERIAIISDIHGNITALNAVLKDIENKKIKWCFSIEGRWAEALGFDVTGLRTFESEKALCTIIKSSSGCFAHNIYKNIRQYTDRAGYTISGNIIGHLLLRAHENGDFVRYIKLWIPIK